MEEENQQQVQQVTKEQQRVTMKDPKKVEAGKRLAAINRKKREAKERRTSSIGEDCWAGLCQQSKPILWLRHYSSSGSDRWSWLLHLFSQERRRSQYAT